MTVIIDESDVDIILTEADSIKLRDDIKNILQNGVHDVLFRKADKSHRLLKSTRDVDVIGEALYEKFANPPPRKDGKVRVESTTAVPTFDTEINQWRSFNVTQVIKIDDISIDVLLRNANINLDGTQS